MIDPSPAAGLSLRSAPIELPGIAADQAIEVRRFWAYAAAFGAVWGVFEVTVGTFVHTLRLPLAGHLLAMVSVAILVAQRQLLPARGLTLATGLVAATCKAISPSGIILGPMLGIAVEALLVELLLLAAPRAWLSAALAGALAVMWPITQKIVTQLLFYGGTVLELYLEGLRRLAQAIGVSGAQGLTAGGVALGVVAVIGAGAALTGKALGLRVARLIEHGADLTYDGQPALDSLLPPTTALRGEAGAVPPPELAWMPRTLRQRRDLLILAAALAAIGSQAAPGALFPALGLTGLLSALGLLRTPALRRLWRPRFWIFTLALAGLSGLLLGQKDLILLGRPLLSSEGALAGLLMVQRGALVFALTSWASVALNREQVLAGARMIGLGHLGQAMSAALGLMPALGRWFAPRDRRQRIGRARGARRAFELLLRALAEAARLAERAAALEGGSARRELRVIALVGARGSGKTRAVQRLSVLLQQRGVAVGGICQPAHDGRGGYDLLDLTSGARRPFAQRRDHTSRASADLDQAGGAALGFRFDPDGWGWAARRLTRAWSSAQVLLVDELGKLEAAGGGHLAALAAPLTGLVAGAPAPHPTTLILAVQRSVLADVERRLGGLDQVLELPASGAAIDALGAAIGETR